MRKNKHTRPLRLRVRLLVSFLVSIALALLVMAIYGDVVNHYPFAPQVSFLGYVLFALVFTSSFAYLTHPIISYLDQLVRDIQIIATGNLHHRTVVKGNDELSILALNINEMSERLEHDFEQQLQAERAKMELITNISHDVRTPLTALIGYLRLVHSGMYQDEQERKSFEDIAFRRALQLEKLVDDLFEYTKLANDDVPLDVQTCNLSTLVEQLIGEKHQTSASLRVMIQTKMPQHPVHAQIDVEKMMRVFDNLLSNALNYCSKPSVIHVELQEQETAVRVSMTNRTTPISREDQARLFERFFRVEQSRNRATGGSGLGLSISKSIVEKHGGSIDLEFFEPDTIQFSVVLPKRCD